MKRALVTGITGQDGSYLAELLLSRGYQVYGLVRRSSTSSTSRIQHLLDEPRSRLTLLPADLLDSHSLLNAVEEARPDEVYNLAAQSAVQSSWNQPILTAEFTGV